MLWRFSNAFVNPDYPAEKASEGEAIVRQENAIKDAIENTYSKCESVQKGGEIYDATYDRVRTEINSRE